jgi:predicted DNA-binding transcriptional regulator YafY
MAVYSKKTFGMYGGKEEKVCLRCENHLAGVMIDRFGRDVSFFRADSRHFDIYVNVAVSPHFLTWIMNFGDQIKIISPESVKDELVSLAKKTLSQYE